MQLDKNKQFVRHGVLKEKRKAVKTYKGFSFDILSYKPGKETLLIQLLRLTRNNASTIHHTEEFWRWKHLQNPFGKSYGIYGWDERQQKVIGLRMLMRWIFKTPNGSRVYAARCVDTATHPEYQRKGIFTTLTQQALDDIKKDGIRFIFNTPNPKTSLPGYLKLGWKIVGYMPLYVRVLSPCLSRKNVSKKEILTWRSFQRKYKNNISYLVERWESKRKQIGYRIVKDLNYLHWRYGKCPCFNYRIYTTADEKGLQGFAILHLTRWHELKSAMLTDIFLRNPDLQLGLYFLKNLTQDLQVNYITAYFAKGTLEHEILIRSEFQQKSKKGLILTAYQLNLLPLNLFHTKNWDFTLGDLEIF